MWLDECLRSVMFSSRRPDEVLVVDDSSEDDTAGVAGRWADWGVQYLRVEHRNVRQARLAGLNATTAEFACFVDADDRLSPDYLRSGLQAFDRHDIGFVYSDADRFGDENSLLIQPEEISVENMSRLNHVHNGAIVRREALEMSRALEVPADPATVHEDWLVWRRILEQGWRAKKQRATYGYRRHPGGVSVAKQSERP
jgi:glycosyltransferase involved in cell wall biosynthesis